MPPSPSHANLLSCQRPGHPNPHCTDCINLKAHAEARQEWEKKNLPNGYHLCPAPGCTVGIKNSRTCHGHRHWHPGPPANEGPLEVRIPREKVLFVNPNERGTLSDFYRRAKAMGYAYMRSGQGEVYAIRLHAPVLIGHESTVLEPKLSKKLETEEDRAFWAHAQATKAQAEAFPLVAQVQAQTKAQAEPEPADAPATFDWETAPINEPAPATCGLVPPTPGYAPCKRPPHKDGPCAHELLEDLSLPPVEADERQILLQRIDELEAEKETLQAEVTAASEKIKKLEGDVYTVRTDACRKGSEMILKIRDLEKRNKELRTEYDACSKDRDLAKQRNGNIENHLAKVLGRYPSDLCDGYIDERVIAGIDKLHVEQGKVITELQHKLENQSHEIKRLNQVIVDARKDRETEIGTAVHKALESASTGKPGFARIPEGPGAFVPPTDEIYWADYRMTPAQSAETALERGKKYFAFANTKAYYSVTPVPVYISPVELEAVKINCEKFERERDSFQRDLWDVKRDLESVSKELAKVTKERDDLVEMRSQAHDALDRARYPTQGIVPVRIIHLVEEMQARLTRVQEVNKIFEEAGIKVTDGGPHHTAIARAKAATALIRTVTEERLYAVKRLAAIGEVAKKIVSGEDL